MSVFGGQERLVSNETIGDPEYRAKCAARVLSLAKQLLAGQLNVIAAARQLSALRHDFDPELDTPLRVFVGIASETDDLPVGELRQYWASDALERNDREIAEVERLYHDSAIEAATKLVRLLEVPS
jgi:hypothetical protein